MNDRQEEYERNVAGNFYDKYQTQNPIAKHLMSGFIGSFTTLAKQSKAMSAYEFGCGEGELARLMTSLGIKVAASDVDDEIIAEAQFRENNANGEIQYEVKSIYSFDPSEISADLVVCCEVFEHLESPEEALAMLRQVQAEHYIFSVPREPLWRVLNVSRGKYLKQFGNTPGHLQHWSKNRFKSFVAQHFQIVETLSPTPWTMILCKPK